SVNIPNDFGKASEVEYYRVSSKNEAVIKSLNEFIKAKAADIAALRKKWSITAGS
ncbi:MAG: hypothetical protein HQK54_15540, partial [Oligoflexales bacterium]|nr:hypothetical protein [Oligoflexales bacterium]